MPVVNCPIDIPEGWEFVRYGLVHSTERYLRADGGIGVATAEDERRGTCRIIIRRARPAIEVGDWARVDKDDCAIDGCIGLVRAIDEPGEIMLEIGSNGAAGFFKRNELIKQSRTIEPYTIDQFMVEAAKRGRHVQCGSKSTLIESIHIAGVTLSCPSIGFMPYVDAASQLTWSGGEAFGVETWRDAE